MRSVFVPSGRLVALVGIAAAAALVVPIPIVLIALAVLVGVLTVDLLAARRQVDAARSLAPVLSRGVPSPLTITVSTARQAGAGQDSDGQAATVEIRQAVTPDVVIDDPVATISPVEPLVTSLTPRRRGHHELPPVAIRRTGPLGLATMTSRGTDTIAFDVYPDMPAALRLAHAVRTGQFDDDGQTRRGALGLGTDFESIRDYQPDDDIRLVNWPATVRAGRPMSNQYREDQDREVICLIDAGRLMTSPVGDRTRLDAALDAVAAVGAVADVVGDRVGGVAFADRVLRTVPTRRAGGWPLMRALHDLEPLTVDSDYRAAFHGVAGAKRSLVLVFTDLIEDAAAEPLIAAVPVLARRHAVLIASVADPDELTMLRSDPESVEDVFAASVLAELFDTRATVVSRLRSAGATVVDASPDRLSRACVGSYLSLKARARV